MYTAKKHKAILNQFRCGSTLKYGRTGLTFVVLLSLSLILTGIRPVHAWNFGINASPDTRYAFPGQTVTYNVAVSLLTGPAEVVQLMVSPMTVDLLGFSFWFSPSSSGTPPFTRTLYVTVSSSKAPGTYSIPVTGFNVHVGWRPDGVTLVVLPSSPTTDWALSNPTMNPVSPKVGDPTTFSVLLSTLSTNRPYPQSVRIGAIFDGVFLGTVTVSYPGPTGYPALLTTASIPWTAKEGYHTMVLIVDPSPYSYDDPNRYNNQVSMSFSVSAAPPPFDFSVSASPPAQKVTAGETTSYMIVVSLVSSTSQPVTLSLVGLPSGATYLFNPLSSSPTFQSTLGVTTTNSALAGIYTLTLTASGGGVTRTTNLSLEIEPAPVEDFTIIISPPSSEIAQGSDATFVVTINSIAGFKSAVDLSALGMPTEATPTFSLSKLTPGGSCILTMKTTRNTPIGTYAITITATGAGKVHDATVGLTIKQGPPPSLFEILAQYSLILVVSLIVLAVLVMILFRRRGKPSSKPAPPPTPASTPKTPSAFCASCGSKIPDDAEFCPKCGAKKVAA
jgi:hypothetical protein